MIAFSSAPESCLKNKELVGQVEGWFDYMDKVIEEASGNWSELGDQCVPQVVEHDKKRLAFYNNVLFTCSFQYWCLISYVACLSSKFMATASLRKNGYPMCKQKIVVGACMVLHNLFVSIIVKIQTLLGLVLIHILSQQYQNGIANMWLHRMVLLWKPMPPLWTFFVISWPLLLLLPGTLKQKHAISWLGAALQAK